MNPKDNRKQILKIWVEINEVETKKTIERINETESWFTENINKIDKSFLVIDKPLGRLTKKKEERIL